MSDEIKKTSAEIVIGGNIKVIQKLKAGKFYEAQKVIATIFKETSKLSSTKSVESENGEMTPDTKDMDIGALVNLFEDFPSHVAKFVAICSETLEEELLKEAYPEEINDAFGVCLELNNVMENLKNSVAPMGKLGALTKKEG
ncbi:MAG: hypothetical protein WC979_10115 [Candidatus Pacearchaeota archaeon]|jgi:hypothetical protein